MSEHRQTRYGHSVVVGDLEARRAMPEEGHALRICPPAGNVRTESRCCHGGQRRAGSAVRTAASGAADALRSRAPRPCRDGLPADRRAHASRLEGPAGKGSGRGREGSGSSGTPSHTPCSALIVSLPASTEDRLRDGSEHTLLGAESPPSKDRLPPWSRAHTCGESRGTVRDGVTNGARACTSRQRRWRSSGRGVPSTYASGVGTGGTSGALCAARWPGGLPRCSLNNVLRRSVLAA
jgi:hypothetical protein